MRYTPDGCAAALQPAPAGEPPTFAVSESSPPQQRMLTPRTEESPDLAPAPTHEGRGTLYLVPAAPGCNLALLGSSPSRACPVPQSAGAADRRRSRCPRPRAERRRLGAANHHTPPSRRTPRALPPPLVCTFQWRAFRCVEGCTFKVSNLLRRRLCTARGVDEKRRRN